MEEQILRFYLKVFSFLLIFVIYFFYIFLVREIDLKNDYFFIKKNENYNNIVKNNIIDYNFNLFFYKIALRLLLYTNNEMLSKLMEAYLECCKGQKTLIFNNGINTSLYVYDIFNRAGLPIAHLDNTTSKKERANILKWFKETPGAILTSVSILTTSSVSIYKIYHHHHEWSKRSTLAFQSSNKTFFVNELGAS